MVHKKKTYEVRQRKSYKNLSERYAITKEDFIRETFHKQYHFLYRARVEALRDRILTNARQIIDPDVKISQLADIKMDPDLHFIFGSILKRMRYRPTVLDEFVDEENIEEDTKTNGYSLTDDEDLFEFEDDQQIVKIEGNIDKRDFVTGDIIGLYGRQVKEDLFSVEQFVLPKIADQVPWPITENDSYVVFISGILCSSKQDVNNEETMHALEEFRQWMNSQGDFSKEEQKMLQNIDRLIIAGDSIRFHEDDYGKIKVSDFRDLETDKDAFSILDQFLDSILHNISVDVMSGINDPCSSMVPQEPMPRVIFPLANSASKIPGHCVYSTVSNPYKFSLNGVRFLGTSGQNITDLLKYTDGKSAHELMERTIDYGHIFPTVPDTIDGFPFQDRDPLVFDDIPHVYFIGNQENFQRSVVEKDNGAKTLFLSIPVFSRTKSVVVANIRTLEAMEYTFSGKSDLKFRQKEDE